MSNSRRPGGAPAPFSRWRNQIVLSGYKAVFFDVGGTLLRVHPSVGAVYAEHARPFGFGGSADEVQDRFRLEWARSGGIESLGNQTGDRAEKQFWSDLVFSVFEHFGGLNNFNEYFELIYEVFSQKESWRLFEDVAESRLLEKLKSRGVVLGVISNWDSRLPVLLENMDLDGYFDFILASSVVGSAKPDKKIFLEALKTSRVNAAEACHIGDDTRSDIEGARAVGMDAILIDRKGSTENGGYPRIRSFLELTQGL